MEDIIRTILVDDDEEALTLLETYLKSLDDVEIVGRATSGFEGLRIIAENYPDLLFLDIDMPDINGIEVARIMKERNYKTQIVFTTAFNKYAYDAITAEPLDYLIKPFGPETLESVVAKFKQRLNKEEDERRFEILIQSQRTYGKIKFPTLNGVIILHADDVALMKAAGNGCVLYLSDGTIETVTVSLFRVIKNFKSPNIYRISRSIAINMKFLWRVDRKNKTCIIAVEGNNYEEALSRSNINFFEEMKCFPIS